jgi:hypothetical protein
LLFEAFSRLLFVFQVYNVSQLPKRLLYASGDPRDESLFVDAAQKTLVW